ncbi:ead/Ea22-like family protein [Enterobacter hormaechei subsp. steigerwaltii]
MSNIDIRALREAAVRAGGVKWQYMRATQHSKAYITDDKGSTVVNCTDGDVPAKCAGFLESANPAAVLALLDELEESERLRLKFQHANCELCQKLEAAEKTSAARLGAIDTTHKMFQRERDRAEKAEKQIAGYQELISSLVGISSSILREVERINNAAAAGKGE